MSTTDGRTAGSVSLDSSCQGLYLVMGEYGDGLFPGGKLCDSLFFLDASGIKHYICREGRQRVRISGKKKTD